MKQFLLFVCSIFILTSIIASPVDEQQALKVAETFYGSVSSSSLKSGNQLSLAYKSEPKESSRLKTGGSQTYYYVYNSSNGFIIIAGDDASLPILGYSTETTFDANKIPQSIAKWLDGYKSQVQYIVDNNIAANKEIKIEWTKLLNGEQPVKTRASVAPLLKTKWNQSPYVNDKCPYDNARKERTLTGCPATAMAQIMKFWAYPKKGIGFHSYKHDTYGTLSVNFSSVNYDWANMPNEVNAANTAVATLMYHCGVASEMDYGVDASGTYVIENSYTKGRCVQNALKTYFGYANTMQGLERSDYTDANWLTLLKNELTAGRPIQYAGYGQGGHTFVLDGFDSNNYFHVNWGWGGYLDGYFNLNALNPGTGGAGAGAGSYNSNQQALIGIKPPDTVSSFDLDINKDVTVDKASISYGDAFSISTDIKNSGTANFAGDYCAAAFDKNGVFVDYIETKTANTLQANYHYTNGISFATTGLLTLLPGTYTIYIYYRQTGGSWVGLKANAASPSMIDYTTIEVTNTNDIQLYASMQVNDENNIFTGNSFSVTLDVVNRSATSFAGTLSLGIYNLEGDSVAAVANKDITELKSNYHYSDGLTFTTNQLNLEPGTYLLALAHRWTGKNWELTGSTTNYSNPIQIIVKEQPYKADMYEVNNDKETAYLLYQSFTNNIAKVQTTGSNLHLSTDYDYYKLALDAGYNYTIAPQIQDSYNSDTDVEYTVDGSFEYSTNGTTWSESFDDVASTNISVVGSGIVYFRVSSFFYGETGSYILDLNVTRSENTQKRLSASSNFIALDLAASTVVFDVTANVSWTATCSDTWFSINKTSGSNNATISLSATENNTGASRTGTITFEGEGLTKTIQVSQAIVSNTIVWNKPAIHIYPNPASSFVQIDLTNFDKTIISAKLIDVQGITQLSIDGAILQNQSIALENICDGTYCVVLTDQNGQTYSQIILVQK